MCLRAVGMRARDGRRPQQAPHAAVLCRGRFLPARRSGNHAGEAHPGATLTSPMSCTVRGSAPTGANTTGSWDEVVSPRTRRRASCARGVPRWRSRRRVRATRPRHEPDPGIETSPRRIAASQDVRSPPGGSPLRAAAVNHGLHRITSGRNPQVLDGWPHKARGRADMDDVRDTFCCIDEDPSRAREKTLVHTPVIGVNYDTSSPYRYLENLIVCTVMVVTFLAPGVGVPVPRSAAAPESPRGRVKFS